MKKENYEGSTKEKYGAIRKRGDCEGSVRKRIIR